MFAGNVTYVQRARDVFWLKAKVARGRGNSRPTCGGSVAACLVVAPGRRFSRAGGTGDPIQEGLKYYRRFSVYLICSSQLHTLILAKATQESPKEINLRWATCFFSQTLFYKFYLTENFENDERLKSLLSFS